MTQLHAAPLQGYTEAPWRRFHSDIYGAPDRYYTPFIRVEKGDIRPRDTRDLTSSLNGGIPVTPQIIFRDLDEARLLLDRIIAAGHHSVDLNLGCPFPPQVKHGRGAALLLKPDLILSLGELLRSCYPELKVSVKMRVGVDSPHQWADIIDAVNSLPLAHITVHPRIARQQYSGSLYLDEMSSILDAATCPVVFNGDILTPADIDSTLNRMPSLAGVMVGRGLLARPSLFAEWREGREWTPARRRDALLHFHSQLYSHARATYCGDTQILSKIRPFWDYLEPVIGHCTFKSIKKATSLTRYEAAVNAL